MKPARDPAQPKARRPRRPATDRKEEAPADAPRASAAEPRVAAPEPAPAREPAALSTAEEDALVRRTQRRLAAGAGVLALGALIYAGLEFGAPGVVLLLVGAALIGVIAAFWSSVRTLLGESRLTGADAFAIGAPRAEEEQKRAVLRALKDLEFERAVGKISDDDYAVLVARYRDEAKLLLRQIDKSSMDQRAKADAVVRARLERAGLAPSVDRGPEGAEAEGASQDKGDAAAEEKTDAGADAAEEKTDAGADAAEEKTDAGADAAEEKTDAAEEKAEAEAEAEAEGEAKPRREEGSVDA